MARNYGNRKSSLPWEDDDDGVFSKANQAKARNNASKGRAVRSVAAPRVGSGSAPVRFDPKTGIFAATPFAGFGKKPFIAPGTSTISASEIRKRNAASDYSGARAGKVSTPIVRRPQGNGAIGGVLGNLKGSILAALANLGNDEEVAEDLPVFGKSLQDYIDQYGDGGSLISGEMSGISAREAALRGQAATGDSKIAEIYAQLQNSMAQEGTDSAARYAAAGQAAQTNTAGAQANIAQARNSAAGAQAEIARNLGMTDVPASNSANQATLDAANAQSELATTGKSTVDYMASLGNAQQDFYTGNKAAAGYRGAEARSALQGDLTGRLAELQDERSQLQSQAKERALALAQAMYSADYGQFNDERGYRDSREDQGYARGQDQYQMEQEYAQQNADRAASSAEFALKNQPKAQDAPFFQQVEQSLAQAMPQETVNAALAAMAQAKENGMNSMGRNSLKGIDPRYHNLILQWGQEYLKNYDY